ncbi:hypothetical protein [Amycolatopsis sp. DG1A-15b]|uniref:hypothetical protein n=1 Tax=Amycolatopsis sp. DG1A-15b TaxID=3052846 RepID=UPI00255BFC03|nr:hypothetical protein [Amycolatopsis sp. DG1A-15b]WIX91079.1 hypothetical protein QRY02_11790 [Amycolatopsis sp. DG1A-15b]
MSTAPAVLSPAGVKRPGAATGSRTGTFRRPPRSEIIHHPFEWITAVDLHRERHRSHAK